MRVRVDRDLCVGAGQCLASRVFDQAEDGLVVVVEENPSPADRDGVRRVTALCPTSAILIEE
jgi:ferredoxin